MVTEEIQRQLNIGREEAESYKCGGSGAGMVPSEVSDIVVASVDQLAGEIQRSLDFYVATSGDRSLSRIYCSGGTANIQALLDSIGQRAQVPVEVLDASRAAMTDGPATHQLMGRQPQAVVSMGLALRKERERN